MDMRCRHGMERGRGVCLTGGGKGGGLEMEKGLAVRLRVRSRVGGKTRVYMCMWRCEGVLYGRAG